MRLNKMQMKDTKSVKLRRIGMLGGMGVEATIALMQRVHGATLAEDDKDQVPMIIDMNPQVPSRIEHLIKQSGVNPGPTLADMAARLEVAGAEALVIPCNTAHYYADWVEASSEIPLIHMPKLTCAHLAKLLPAGSGVGILASPATEQIGLFQSLLEDVGLTAIYPKNTTAILASIQRIKKAGPCADDLALLNEEVIRLKNRGACAILVGCTEFSLLSKQIKSDISIVDGLDILVDEIIAFSGAKRRQ
ncbi:amino acid racemase [Lentilitoribacter sp. Alg239-R112]|uniref:aspartate/glutamate racemase family protein n=1 Tax=Lentilitoribacter sp. Alg239-R112 TaxID=2305987 RepID=UPI0018D60FD3|nr:amino acid racemase [Lentilitoribacter sp. Alg239-R112]